MGNQLAQALQAAGATPSTPITAPQERPTCQDQAIIGLIDLAGLQALREPLLVALVTEELAVTTKEYTDPFERLLEEIVPNTRWARMELDALDSVFPKHVITQLEGS